MLAQHFVILLFQHGAADAWNADKFGGVFVIDNRHKSIILSFLDVY